MKKFLQEHTLCFAVIVVLVIVNLVSWGALYRYQQDHPADLTLRGTFIANEGFGPYLVFTPEGALHRYDQGGGTVEVGSYTQKGEFVSVEGEMGQFQILIKGNRLYAWEENGYLAVYRPLDSHPIYINVPIPEG